MAFRDRCYYPHVRDAERCLEIWNNLRSATNKHWNCLSKDMKINTKLGQPKESGRTYDTLYLMSGSWEAKLEEGLPEDTGWRSGKSLGRAGSQAKVWSQAKSHRERLHPSPPGCALPHLSVRVFLGRKSHGQPSPTQHTGAHNQWRGIWGMWPETQ